MADIVAKLEESVAAGRARHAYLLTGVDPDRTDGIARRIASLLLFGGIDIERLEDTADYIELEGGITIGKFRDEIQPEIYRETYDQSCRAVIFRSAHLLSPMVQNAMLKVLEEPPADTHFILTGNEYGILPTIRSRCTIVRCPALSAEAAAAELVSRGADKKTAELYAKMSGCVLKRALRFYEDEAFRKMRSELYSAFISAMRGAPDYRFSKTKRDREDWMEANELLLLLAHDMLRVACGLGVEYCPDMTDEIKKLCSVFTIGDFGCIIERLKDNARRSATNAGGSAVFDRLLSETALECTRRIRG